MKLQKHTQNHHMRGLQPVLRAMQAKGHRGEECLKGSGIELSALLSEEQSLALEQEFQIYRNLQTLEPNGLLGLELGQAFELQSYGVLGYAILSAATMADALSLVAEFGELTFSHFKISIETIGEYSGFVFSPHYDVPADLLQIYSDRDVAAAMSALSSFSLHQQKAKKILLMHDDYAEKSRYEHHFSCAVEFSQPLNALLFSPELLNQPMPQRDAQAAGYLRQQCEQLLANFNKQGGFIDKVRNLVLQNPGEFPSIKEVAELLFLSERSLRRRLAEEDSSYQDILNETRCELAKQYLQSGLSVEQTSELLNYSETANFSHAFKRWTGLSPVQFRKLV